MTRMVAGALERVDFVDFLNQPRPAGLATCVGRLFFDADRSGNFITALNEPSRAPGAVRIVAVVANEMFILVRDVVHEHAQPFDGGHELVPNKTVWSFTFDGARSGRWSKEPDTSGCFASVKPGAMMAYDRSQKLKVFFGGGENAPDGMIAYDETVICE
jgi:hypothetical protein